MTLPDTMPAHRAFPAVSFAAVRAELAEEAARRRKVYPQQIAKARMTQGQADRQLALLTEIAQDLAWVQSFPAHQGRNTPGAAAEPAGMEVAQRPNISAGDPLPTFSWAEKRTELKRELGLRGRFYPGWIAQGTLDPAEAAHRIACVTAMLALYNEGLRWLPEPGSTPQQRHAQWAATAAAIDAETGASTNQKELAL